MTEQVENIPEQGEKDGLYSEVAFRTLIDQMLDSLLILDWDGTILFANPAAADMVHLSSPEEGIGRNTLEFVHPDFLETVILDQMKVMEQSGGFFNKYKLVTAKGEERWVEGLGSVIPFRGKTANLVTLRDITSRQNTEDALKESERRLHELTVLQNAILNSANYSIISTKPDGIIQTFNEVAQRWLGYTEEEVVGKATPRIFHDVQEIKTYADELSRTLGYPIQPNFDVFVAKVREGMLDEKEWTYIRKDGSTFPVLLSITALRDETGSITGYLGIADDITERRSAEEALRKLSRAVEQSPVSVVITDTEGNIEYVNPKFTRLTGYRAEEVIGYNPRMLKSGETPAAEYKTLWDTITAGQEWRGVFHNKKKNGELYWESASISPVKDQEGKITHFVAVKEDITEIKRVQEELAKLSLVASKTDNAVIISDKDGFIEWVNDGFTRITGFSFAESVGNKPGNLLQGPLTDPAAIQRISDALKLKNSFTEEILNYHKDGHTCWLSITITPIRNDHGEVIKFIAIENDISERKRVENELHQARKAAEEANRTKSDFLASMSHEIRTPMNAIIGMAELLEDTPLNEEQVKYVKIFKTAGENLLTIINDILDISKVEAGQMTLEYIPFSLQEVIGNACAFMADRAKKKHLELSCHIDSESCNAVIGDPTRLQQILINLIGNAIKFTEHGAVNVTAATQKADLDGNQADACSVHLSVQDTGIGIPPEKLTTIFERFTQADSSVTRRYGGTGLGLAISRRLTELMGGRLWVESVVGQGSTFHCSLPLRLQVAAEQQTVVSSPSRPLESAPSEDRPLRILLVEDSDDNRLLIMAYLKGSAYKIDVAVNGAEAVGLFQARLYDLILMDMQMPVMDGYTATRIIRRWEEEQGRTRTPVIALTAYALKEDALKSREAGCDTHLTKPIKKAVLLEGIRQWTVQV